MPKIDFTFQGYVSGANVKTVYNVKGGFEVDVAKLPAEVVAKNLKDGVWAIALVDYVNQDPYCPTKVRHTEIGLSDFEAHKS